MNRKPKDEIIFSTGYGPSGLPHIGTFSEVARTTMVRHAFRVLTDDKVNTRLIAFSDDMDGLRKVPDNVPNKELLEKHLGKPLTQVPDPFGTLPSFGEHNNARLRTFLDHFGFDYEFMSSTLCYKSGRFNQALLNLLEHFDREKLKPRYLTSEEIKAFFDWLNERWGGWRLPILFLTVKSFLGNRIGELCSLRSEQLQDGRIVFPADNTKGRAERKAFLPPAIFDELKATAGPTYVWEAYPAQLLERSTAMGKPVTNLRSDFSPQRLQWFMQGEIADYCQSHPDVKRFSAHAFRKRAMTVAWQLDIPLEKAALAFGCNSTTMRTHYIALDETATADEVLSAIASVVKPIGDTTPDAATEKKSPESALPQGDSAA